MRAGPLGWSHLVHCDRDDRNSVVCDQRHDCGERSEHRRLGYSHAFATALGGGTLRDILLGPSAQPFFWVVLPFYIVAIFAIAVAYANIGLVRDMIGRRDYVIKESAELIALASLGASAPRKPSRYSRQPSDPSPGERCSFDPGRL